MRGRFETRHHNYIDTTAGMVSGTAKRRVGFYLFFQAEVGIRDDLVTGVQTCALPILACNDQCIAAFQFHSPIALFCSATSSPMPLRARRSISPNCSSLNGAPSAVPWISTNPPRSEERRVGKERVGWIWRLCEKEK